MWPLFVVVFTRRYIWSAICIASPFPDRFAFQR
jgi:hypothetical protein